MKRRALVLGLGRFGGGREATRFLLRRGWRVRVADRAGPDQLAASVAALGAALGDHDDLEWRLGDQSTGLLDGVELVVVNPAIPDAHPLLAAARQGGIHLTQEIDLFLDAFPGRVVLVTGTNGKSTTATLLAAALRTGPDPVLLGGNIGHSLLEDEPAWTTAATAVVEISSFQLARLAPGRRLAGAVLTQITTDHLDRHGTLAAYRTAKSVAAATATGFLVHGAADHVATGFATPAAQRITFSRGAPAPGQVGLEAGWITSRLADPGRVIHQDAVLLPGAFQLDNLMAAFAAAVSLGADRQPAAMSLCVQRPLPYRLQQVGQWRGLRLFDNSVSTEVQSTVAALASLSGPVHWVGGGRSKDGDYVAVARAVAPHVSTAHLFGEAAPALAEQLAAVGLTAADVTVHQRLERALDTALRRGQPGATLLFSPAFASFDQYPNFRARAEAFHRWLAAPSTTSEASAQAGGTP